MICCDWKVKARWKKGSVVEILRGSTRCGGDEEKTGRLSSEIHEGPLRRLQRGGSLIIEELPRESFFSTLVRRNQELRMKTFEKM